MTKLRNLTHDFVRRTKANLETIERLAQDAPNENFEVTQLINSCVGLLFVPTEDQIDRLRNVSIPTFLGTISPPQVLSGDLKYDNAAGLVRYLRNAFAHLNFDFEYSDNLIQGAYVWNVDEKHRVNWVAYLRIEDLRATLGRLAEHYMKLVTPHEQRNGRLAKLEEETGKRLRLTNPSCKQ